MFILFINVYPYEVDPYPIPPSSPPLTHHFPSICINSSHLSTSYQVLPGLSLN